MQKKLWILFLLLLFVSPILATEPGLGLRTITPATPTEIEEVATTTEEMISDTPTGPISLKTIDSLLLNFREGWKVSDLPGWKSTKIGTLDLKVPSGFTATFEMSGKNIDVEIIDVEGYRLAHIYIYQLQSYEVEELREQLLPQLFGSKYTGETDFEEFKDLGTGKTVYLTRVKMDMENVTYPIVFVYNRGEEQKDIIPGEVAMMIFEPGKYAMEVDRLNSWIEGIAASYIKQVTVPVKEEEKEIVKEEEIKEEVLVETGDPFVDYVLDVIDGKKEPMDLPEYWYYIYGDYMEFYYPNEFSIDIDYYEDDDMEIADLDFDGIVAKIIVGYTEERESFSSYLDWIIDAYLPEGEKYYTAINENRGPLEDYGGYVKLYRLDSSDSYYWILIYSDSESPGIIYDEYMTFIGWADMKEPEYWAAFYNPIIFSIDF